MQAKKLCRIGKETKKTVDKNKSVAMNVDKTMKLKFTTLKYLSFCLAHSAEQKTSHLLIDEFLKGINLNP